MSAQGGGKDGQLGPAAVAISSQWCSWLFAFVWTRIGSELLGRWAADPGPRLGDAAETPGLGLEPRFDALKEYEEDYMRQRVSVVSCQVSVKTKERNP